MNFAEYYKTVIKPNYTSIIPDIAAVAGYECLDTYFTYAELFDSKAVVDFGKLEMLPYDDSTIYNAIIATIHQNAPYKWTKLLESTLFEYNPIWNVDGTEKTEYGAKSKTNTNGARSVTNSNGARTTENTSYVVPYDLTEERKTGKDTTTAAAVTDSQTSAESTDTEAENAHTDTITRSGNIGVTSTQSLIDQQRRIVDFNFYSHVLADIITAITQPYFSVDCSDTQYDRMVGMGLW